MSEITDEITYTPGRLAKKLGVSKSKLMNHLRETGLIEQCLVTKSGRWQIPYSLVVRISSAEALSVPSPTPISRQTMPRNKLRQKVSSLSVSSVSSSTPVKKQNEPESVSLPNYAQIGRALQQAGITMVDLIKYIEKQMKEPKSFFNSQQSTINNQQSTINNSQTEVTHEQSQNNSAQRDERT